MRAEAIFGPVSVLAIWTLVVLYLVGARRIGGVRKRRFSRHAFDVGEDPCVPPDVALANRNFMNLLEAPVLFYVVCLALYVTRQVQPGVVIAAWLYVGLRLVHSFIHLTTNRVMHRLIVFATSNLVVLGMWIWFLIRVLY